ncbi:CLUMA_CG002681, isoform A [Clunio marinus]|uniref:CLUMA_CG002681, isoform A n=1 Tax=Clunio marinus TaxID=568069 RepID=A0A1J1HLJ4_9DIPT|nr:CLUMA_CG002681, isoform A [Clunio marinus]
MLLSLLMSLEVYRLKKEESNINHLNICNISTNSNTLTQSSNYLLIISREFESFLSTVKTIKMSAEWGYSIENAKTLNLLPLIHSLLISKDERIT